MGSVMHPRGPAGARAYWRRRLIVVTLLAGFGLAVAWSGTQQFGGKSDEAATVKANFPAVAAEATAALPDCAPENLLFTIDGASSVPIGSTQSLVITVANADRDACLAHITAETFTLRIASGSDQIWSTGSCAAWAPDASPALDPNGTWQWTVEWGTKRARNCDLLDTKLKPGTYVATAAVIGAAPGRLVMKLT